MGILCNYVVSICNNCTINKLVVVRVGFNHIKTKPGINP